MKKALVVFLATAVLGLGGAAIGAWQAYTFPDRTAGSAAGVIAVEIQKGAAARDVAALLVTAGLIERPTFFRLYVAQRGAAARIRPGKYKITAPQTPKALVDLLIKGVADDLVAVTIPEGKNLVEVAELFDAAGITPKAAFLAQVTSAEFARSLDIPGSSLEGYLYPDTYRMRRNTPADKAVLPLVRRHKLVLDDLRATNPSGFEKLRKTVGFGDREIVILASIVEKETGQPEERPRIAQVFLNRLIKPSFQPKRLETDPTIVYGCKVAPLFLGKTSAACAQFTDRIRRIHLDDTDNPYSTYTHEGLPPGPIANPGKAALSAVVRPDGTPYLFFVARNDGTHQFSATRSEHEAAVVKFQRGGKPMAPPHP